MIFHELLQYCKVKAIGDALKPDETAIYREMCRTYSELFHTPLLQVYDIDIEFVLLNVFEHQMKDYETDKNVEPLLETLLRIEDPNFEASEEEEIQTLIKKLQKENQKNKEKNTSEKPEDEIPEDAPKGGSVDFSHLDKEG